MAVAVARRPAAVGLRAGRVAPGLALAAAVGLTAHVAAAVLFPYALAVGFEVPMAMILGLVLINLGGAADWALPGIRFAARYVLGLGIILLGLRLNLQAVAEIGSQALGLVVLTIATGCGFALLAGRRLGVEGRICMLLGIGASICGNSAILATAPVIGADETEVSFAVATITLVGTTTVFVLPLVGHALGLPILTYGMWSGASVPDTAQTIASSAAFSTVSRDVATVVKLVRTALLAPTLLMIAWGWARRGAGRPGERPNVRKAFPFFLVGFIGLAVVRSARVLDPEKLTEVDTVTRACFVVALAGLGLQTRFAHLRAFGPRPFLLGVATTSLLATVSLPLIVALGIGPARTHVRGAVDPRPLGVFTAVCDDGAPPALAGAFLGLRAQLGGRMGRPRECARRVGGATVQRTTRGVATFDSRRGVATFSGGGRTWSLAAVRRPAPAPGADDGGHVPVTRLAGRVVATGIPGAGALSVVGDFHAGGPLNDNRRFDAMTQPGKVLDPTRLLVASTSNFGAPLARADWPAGAVLSLATDGARPVAVPPAFAARGGQASALGGAVTLYTAQSPAFLDRTTDAGAVTAALPAVAEPLGISLNNAFGRPWLASAPAGGIGVESVLDPDGRPLADPPDHRAGGVFAGGVTDRRPERIPGGLAAGAVGNALLGASPDASGRAVFAVATADGAIAQVHVQDGVDGLAPPGTIAPVRPPGRVGMLFNWVPDRFLYVSDPGNDAIVKLRLDDDFHVFKVVSVRRLASRRLHDPVDLAPAVPESANPAFASNTTLAGGADMYVADRGSGTIVCLRQDGRIRAIARIVVPGVGPLGGGLLDGIAVAPDARRIWVSLSATRPDRRRLSGTVLALPAFGAPR